MESLKEGIGSRTRHVQTPGRARSVVYSFSFLLRIPHSALRIFPVLLLLFLAAPAHASWDAQTALRSHILSTYPWADVQLSDLTLSSEQPDQPPSKITVVRRPPGKAVFRLSFRNNRSISATVTVRAFDRVIVTRSAMGKGSLLGPDDVYSTLMETARIPKGAVRDESEADGRTLTRSVVANAVLTEAMVSDTALVKRGRRVVLRAERPGFVIKAAGELKQDASVGTSVKALNLLSKKIVTGRLVDENTVRVEF